tara:strand:- start:325 stop:651 length:327 start_codon:yes stop_codon:yes gene_type:complete
VTDPIELYTQLGVTGVVVCLFTFLLKNLVASQKEQSQDLDEIRQDLSVARSEIKNTMDICVKLIDSINDFKKDVNDKMDRRHEKILENLDDLANSVAYLQGKTNGGSK